MVYIKNFHDEGVLDFLTLFGEEIETQEDADKKAWALGDIVYHICTHIDPEALTSNSKEKDRHALNNLITQEQADLRLRAPVSSRHSRFGTAIMVRTAQGGTTISSSVMENVDTSKGGSLWRREFHNPLTRNEKKANMFHDPFFVDLEEGSVRDHNQLNTHLKNTLEASKPPLDPSVVQGLRKFFEDFAQTCFSSLVRLLRSSLGAPRTSSIFAKPGQEQQAEPPGGPFDRAKLLNFISWFLEFHRHNYSAAVSAAKKANAETPVIDIAAIEGAIDLDMIQFSAARLKEYGKESNMHASMLVMTMRAVAQQVKTVDVVVESKDQDTRDCGEILTQNIIKDDVMANTAWVMKNFKTSSHDPRILSYAVEIFHFMLKLMKLLSERKGSKLEFQVERTSARFVKRAVTTIEQEIASLAEARVIENLFYLLEKYKRLSASLNSMLVKLIYQIIRVRRENIVVFFELSYFVRIQRIYVDPLVRDKRAGKRYTEMVELLRFILRQFFKCAETNKCVFIELLFRKVPENMRENLLESHTVEFAAILDNYENEEYARVLENMRAGETLKQLKTRQQAVQQGSLPWTAEEDELLRSKYPIYAQHPLCAELLASELPEETHRTGAKVRKRLIELGLIVTQRGGGRGPAAGEAGAEAREDGAADDSREPAAKRARTDGVEEADERMLEMDLERLLDEAMDGDGSLETQDKPPAAVSAATALPPSPVKPAKPVFPPSPVKPKAAAAPAADATDSQLEAALEEQLDKDLFSPEKVPSSARRAASQAAEAAATVDKELGAAPDDLERAFEAMLDEATDVLAEPDVFPASAATALAEGEFNLEEALASQLDKEPALLPPTQASPSASRAAAQACLPSKLDKDSFLASAPTPARAAAAANGSATQEDFDLELALEAELDAAEDAVAE
eukprot:SRR837773.13081.p1 GENE.SRR837773.13081~~SRR837773.13081.p1  ORF type:complete len:961 (-),score=323.97 SRR837773.13081:133-2865(-)